METFDSTSMYVFFNPDTTINLQILVSKCLFFIELFALIPSAELPDVNKNRTGCILLLNLHIIHSCGRV